MIIWLLGEYIDRALSGTTDHRTEFQRMIADSSKKTFQGVFVYQLDRFARNRYDSATYKSKLKKNGVRVPSARENISGDASGVLMEAVLEGMAEYYSVELAQKIGAWTLTPKNVSRQAKMLHWVSKLRIRGL